MKSWEWQYTYLIEQILRNGEDRIDRTGVGTRALFGKTIDINLKEGFPAVTTKKLAWNMMESELRWFISGSSDERELARMMHGTRDVSKRVDVTPPGAAEQIFNEVPLNTVWTENANADYWKPKAKYEGDLGRVYGVQWRTWRTGRNIPTPDKDGHIWHLPEEIDQLKNAIEKVKTNPVDRRMIVSAWNPGELDQMALPPCHMMFQLFVNKRGLSLQMYQRSVDTMLGLPFNIASYALLTHMIAQVTGHDVDRLILNLGDVHIYSNHIEAAEMQISRAEFAPPTLWMNPHVESIEDFKREDYQLDNYHHHPTIKMKMAV